MSETEVKSINGRTIADTAARDAIAELQKYSWVSADSPLVLNADKLDDYNTISAYGDKALKAIQEGRQILVRVPNADGGNYTAIYSPVLMYQLPNFENNYLYLFYLRDEKQDLSALLGQAEGTVQMPQYGELKMLLSETYNGSPLGQPYINTSPAVGGAAAKPVFFISATAYGDGCLRYYDNQDRLATIQEVVDAYIAGNAYIMYPISENCAVPDAITSFLAHTDSLSVRTYHGYATMEGSTEADLNAAMAKYLP